MDALDRMNKTVLRQRAEITTALNNPDPQIHDRKKDTPNNVYPIPANDSLNPEDCNDDTINDMIDKRKRSTYHKLPAHQTPTCDTYALHKLKLLADSYRLAIQEYKACQQTRRYNDDATEARRQKFIREGLSQAKKDIRGIQEDIYLQTEYRHLISALHNAESFTSEQDQRERQSENIENKPRTQCLELQTQNEILREKIAALSSKKTEGLTAMQTVISELADLCESTEK